jgi:hypothetical protein
MTKPQAARETPPCPDCGPYSPCKRHDVAARETLRPDPLTPETVESIRRRCEPGVGWSSETMLRVLDAHRAATPDPAEPPGLAAQVEWQIGNAYANGHRDGLSCGVESAGLGFTGCEHLTDDDRPRSPDRAASTVEPGLREAAALIEADPRLHGMDPERLRLARALAAHPSCLGCGDAGDGGPTYCATHGDWLCERCVTAAHLALTPDETA